MKLSSRLLFALYCILTTLLALPGLAYLCHKKRRDPPYGNRVTELLGWYRNGFSHCIWFHTVSVGEAIAARPLIRDFVQRHPEIPVVVTTTTTTGAREIKRIDGITHVYAPLDCPFAVWSFLRHFHPSHLFIMETELWPCLLNLTRAAGTKICVFNARMPEHTCCKYEKHATLTRDLIARNLHQVICQTKDDAERFARIGLSADRITISGSLKYDLSPNETLFAQARFLRNTVWKDCMVLGALSTHNGEDEQLIETFFSLKEIHPHIRLVLVPRHQSGAESSVKFLKEINASFIRRTDTDDELSNLDHDVLIGNTMGEMEFYLGLCDLVFMGGSFVDIGGHNPLEPAYFSLPIITGPYYYNFAEQFDTLIEKGGAYVANDHRRLFNVCEKFLKNPDLLLTTGMNAFDVQQSGRGAIVKTLNTLEETLRQDSELNSYP